MSTEVEGLRVILTGATGMVGEGVLLECLENPAIGRVLMVNRKPFAMKHAKLTELIVPDFLKLDGASGELAGYHACFYCAGISSTGMSEADYSRITYDTPLHFAETLAKLNPQMVFCHVSGAQTDSSEKGRIMWARVKGKAENALLRLPFRHVYNFRPGFMKPTALQRNVKSYYKAIGSLYPLLRVAFPNHVSTLRDVGRAMINSVIQGYPKQILEVRDINALADIQISSIN
jgi:uncharacterized protein YbjT (DUF2867 family)